MTDITNTSNSAGLVFSLYDSSSISNFERVFEIFKELVTYTSGEVEEALDWLKELDKEYSIFRNDYSFEDFIEDLKKRGYLREEINQEDVKGGLQDGDDEEQKRATLKMTAKLEQALRKHSLDQLFGKLRKSGSGDHKSNKLGSGDEKTGDLRQYQYGDQLFDVNITESIKNAQVNHGVGSFNLTENDLVVDERQHKSQMSTVLMIDISHSMILYGEDRITPAKKVAMALVELIKTKYPKDSIDVIVFGNDAWPIPIKDLPYLKVGPYHTNTVAGLELAMDILRRKRHTNRQIFMITDGKPSCLRLPNGEYYKNSFGLDQQIIAKCYNMAAQARKLKIPITTFMIAQDPYLQQFVNEFTAQNQGKAFYTGLKGLGEMIFEDYERNRIKKI